MLISKFEFYKRNYRLASKLWMPVIHTIFFEEADEYILTQKFPKLPVFEYLKVMEALKLLEVKENYYEFTDLFFNWIKDAYAICACKPDYERLNPNIIKVASNIIYSKLDPKKIQTQTIILLKEGLKNGNKIKELTRIEGVDSITIVCIKPFLELLINKNNPHETPVINFDTSLLSFSRETKENLVHS